MKKTIWKLAFFTLSGLLLGFNASASAPHKAQLYGAWQQKAASADGELMHTLLFSGQYFSWTIYRAESGAFISTQGGSWALAGEKLRIEYEFSSADSTRVGTAEEWTLTYQGAQLFLEGAGGPAGAWQAVDAGTTTALSGPWLFSGREHEGEITRRNTDQPRKTMKMLTGSRFQWVAFDTETKRFFGTGGGTYTAENGVYTERIEFFSRDDARVGAELQFQFRVDGADWHHQGKSTAGDPMYEIWSKRQ
jgi:hypothetical protein